MDGCRLYLPDAYSSLASLPVTEAIPMDKSSAVLSSTRCVSTIKVCTSARYLLFCNSVSIIF